MTDWQERFLAGLFATWFTLKRKRVKPAKSEIEAGKACAESTRFTYNALLRTMRTRKRVELALEENEPKHIEEWGKECWCGEVHGRIRLVQ